VEACAATWLTAFVAPRRACRRLSGRGIARIRLSLAVPKRNFRRRLNVPTPPNNSSAAAIVHAIEMKRISTSVMICRAWRVSRSDRVGFWTAMGPVDQRSMLVRAIPLPEIQYVPRGRLSAESRTGETSTVNRPERPRPHPRENDSAVAATIEPGAKAHPVLPPTWLRVVGPGWTPGAATQPSRTAQVFQRTRVPTSRARPS
jgi:hypothetical protein